MAVPEKLEEKLGPIVEKLERLCDSYVIKTVQETERDYTEPLRVREEVGYFLAFVDTLDKKYVIALDSEIDMLRNGDLEDFDRGRLYADVVLKLRLLLMREIHRKYAAAIRAILEYQQNNADASTGAIQQEWLAPRHKVTGTIQLSALPESLLEDLSLEKSTGTLDELSLSKIQDVAHRLAVVVSVGGNCGG